VSITCHIFVFDNKTNTIVPHNMAKSKTCISVNV